MKVIGKTVNDSETSVEIDLFEGRSLKKRAKNRIQQDVGEFLVEQSLIAMSKKTSPVQGAPNFAPLSKNYKKFKLEEVGSGEANLEFDGQLKDEFNYAPTDKGIAIGVFGDRAGAFDGHNNLSGKSSLPLRQSVPDVGQKFKGNIEREVKRIITDVVADEVSFKAKDFQGVTTKKALYDVLTRLLGDMSRGEISLTVYRNEDLTDLLSELDLLRLL